MTWIFFQKFGGTSKWGTNGSRMVFCLLFNVNDGNRIENLLSVPNDAAFRLYYRRWRKSRHGIPGTARHCDAPTRLVHHRRPPEPLDFTEFYRVFLLFRPLGPNKRGGCQMAKIRRCRVWFVGLLTGWCSCFIQFWGRRCGGVAIKAADETGADGRRHKSLAVMERYVGPAEAPRWLAPRFLPRFYRVSLAWTRFGWVLRGFTYFSQVLPRFIALYRVSPSFTEFCRVLLGINHIKWVSPGFNHFNWV